VSPPALSAVPTGVYGPAASAGWDRYTAGFRYVGPANLEEARRLGVI